MLLSRLKAKTSRNYSQALEHEGQNLLCEWILSESFFSLLRPCQHSYVKKTGFTSQLPTRFCRFLFLIAIVIQFRIDSLEPVETRALKVELQLTGTKIINEALEIREQAFSKVKEGSYQETLEILLKGLRSASRLHCMHIVDSD